MNFTGDEDNGRSSSIENLPQPTVWSLQAQRPALIRSGSLLIRAGVLLLVVIGLGLFLLAQKVSTTIAQSPIPGHTETSADEDCIECHVNPQAEQLGALGVGASAIPIVSTHSNIDFITRTQETFEFGCTNCHVFVHGDGPNIKLIGVDVVVSPTTSITTGPVIFTARTGTNSFDDGASSQSSRICVTCHVNANRSGSGTAMTHTGGAGHAAVGGFDAGGADCTTCHSHNPDGASSTLDGFMASCTLCHNQPPDGTTAPNRAGSHTTHFSPTAFGPQLTPGTCTDCHLFDPVGGTHNDGQATFADSRPLSTTIVCDNCHSPGGAFNGVNTTSGGFITDSVGAKDNWYSGVYTSSGATMTLQTGKEKWCVGCHDAGVSVINGIQAPNVAGDTAQSWGFYAGGHGTMPGPVLCTDCHNAGLTHIDGDARTYVAASDNYTAGYRLRNISGLPSLDIPRGDTTYSSDDFALCFSCHDETALRGLPPGYEDWTGFPPDASAITIAAPGTDYRNENSAGVFSRKGRMGNTPYPVNIHWDHLAPPEVLMGSCSWGGGCHSSSDFRYDSDLDGAPTDSKLSCPTCHNPHGTTYPAMTKNDLAITYDTGFAYINSTGYTSAGGDLYCNSDCHVQTGASGPTNAEYYRDPLVTVAGLPVGFQSVTGFQFNEPAGSTVVVNGLGVNGSLLSGLAVESEILTGIVNDPQETLLGDGYFTGDGVDNYVDFENNKTALLAGTALGLEARLKPAGILTGSREYVIFDRGSATQNYQMSIWRDNSWPNGVAAVAFRVNVGGDWKAILTDYNVCAIQANHWYQVKIEWYSNRAAIPGIIYVDDQGPAGDGVGEGWTKYKNCTDLDQSLTVGSLYLNPGDEITTSNDNFTIGANVTDDPAQRHSFVGLIDQLDFYFKEMSSIYLPVILKDTDPGP